MPTATFTEKDLLQSIQSLTGQNMEGMMVVKKSINEKGEVEVFYRPRRP